MGKSDKERLIAAITGSDLTPATARALRELVTMQQAVVTPAAPVKHEYRSKRNGYPCADVVNPCSRTDIRTFDRALIHATTQAELQQAGHSFDKQPLPKS